MDSIPACNSHECQKDTAAAYGVDARAQRESLKLQISSDPICSSAGCPTKKDKGHPKDYFVPNFGMDEDIASTQAHE